MFFTIASLTIYSVIFLVILVGLYNGLSQVCYQVRAEQQRINNIAFMSMKELRALANDNGIRLGRWTKYRIANHLIDVLA